MKKIANITVKGKTKRWSIDVPLLQETIDSMDADGVEVGIIENTIPLWVATYGQPWIKVWCFLQDLWNFNLKFPKKNIKQKEKEKVCIACNGTGRYDHDGSPKCSSCDGTGKEKE